MSESKFDQIQKWYRDLPEKKRYLEFISALLTIPVMVTVLITNTRNIKSQSTPSVPSPSPLAAASSPIVQPSTYLEVVPTPSTTPNPSATPTAISSASPTPTSTPAACKPGVGPVSVVFPQENEVVTKDPVCIDIARQSSDYCSVVWSYRINSGSWSDYLDKSICLYGLTPGQKQLQLKIRSVVNNEEIIINRTFIVDGPTPAPQATNSGTPSM